MHEDLQSRHAHLDVGHLAVDLLHVNLHANREDGLDEVAHVVTAALGQYGLEQPGHDVHVPLGQLLKRLLKDLQDIGRLLDRSVNGVQLLP